MKSFINKLAVSIITVSPALVLAQGAGQVPGQLQILVNRLTSYAIGIIIAISVLFILYAAFLFLMSGSDPGKATEARNVIIYAFVGIGVALAAQILVTIAQQIFTFG